MEIIERQSIGELERPIYCSKFSLFFGPYIFASHCFNFCILFLVSCLLLLVSCLFVLEQPVWAQDERIGKDDVVIIETELGFDQIEEPSEKVDPMPSKHFFKQNKQTALPTGFSDIKFDEGQIIQANRILRQLIEQNEKLRKEREKSDAQLRNLKGQRAIERNRMNTMMLERDAYKEKTEEVLKLKEKLESDVKHVRDLWGEQEEREKGLGAKINELESQIKISQGNEDKDLVLELQRLEAELAQKEKELAEAQKGQSGLEETRGQLPQKILESHEIKKLKDQVIHLENQLVRKIEELEKTQKLLQGVGNVQSQVTKKSQDDEDVGALKREINRLKNQTIQKERVEEDRRDVITMIDDLKVENKKLKVDEARIRYNMGNIFFQRGEYFKAAREYNEAVHLMPHDSNAHFNLAFVSGEYLNDFKTALAHYKMYLRLNPAPEDIALVREKILEAELKLKSEMQGNFSVEQNLVDDRNAYILDYDDNGRGEKKK